VYVRQPWPQWVARPWPVALSVEIGARDKGKRNWSAVVLIIPQGGWLLSKHSTMCKLFFDRRNEIAMPNNPHYHTLKVSLVSPLARNNLKVGHFQGKSFMLFAVALCLFPPLDGVFSPKLL
jgi:hypothetical protein